MRIRYLIPLISTATLLHGANIPAADAPVHGAGAWTPLFDGETLTGWDNPYDWGKAWVENREIQLQANRKFFLCTAIPYKDFEFEAEVRLPSEGHANSGFMFRCHKKHNKVYGYQAEVDPSARAWSGGLYDEGRRAWLWPRKPNNSVSADEFRARTKGAFKKGEWNRYRIICQGDHIRIFVNGIATTDLHDGVDSQGYIALQHHGEKGRIYRFRNIRIRTLATPAPATAISAAANLLSSPPNRIQDTMGVVCPKGAHALLDANSKLDAWQAEKGAGAPITWKLDKGVLTVAPGSGSIVTRKQFTDFRLHLEFNVNEGKAGQANGNSGVYIQRRYEVQILNSFGLPHLRPVECGALYKQRAPDLNACRPPKAWQTVDIEFRSPRWTEDGKKKQNAQITVYQNGLLIHNRIDLLDKTGAGQPEGPAPGPIKLQEHGNPVRFRNIWVLPR